MEGSPNNRAVGALAATRVVGIWKGVDYAALAAFIIVVPRVMGPTLYGRLAALVSLMALLVSTSGLGTGATFGRFLPEYSVTGDRSQARALFIQLFWTRAVLALFLSIGLMAFLPKLLPGLSWFSFTIAGVALLAGAIAATCFQACYGSKQFGKWSSQDPLTRITLLVLLVLLGGAHSLDRAIIAVALSNLVILALGLFWSQDFFKGERAPIRWESVFAHLRFGVTVFAGNLLLITVWRLGEATIVLLSGNSSEAAFFNIANAAVMSASMLTLQVFVMLIPVFTSLYVSGNQAAVEESMGRVLKYVTIGAFFAILAAYIAGPIVIERLLGQRYAVVNANLRALVLALPATALLALGATCGVIWQCPGKTMITNGAALCTFVGAAFLLVPRMISVGASIAVTLAMFTGAAFTCYLFDLAAVLRTARFGRLILVCSVSFAVLILKPVPALITGALAAALFIGLLFTTGILQVVEIRTVVRGLKVRAGDFAQTKSVGAPADEAPHS